MKKTYGRIVVVVAALCSCSLAAFADEIVHFTNGAEMTVLNHAVEKDKSMIRLDLGGGNFIAFPMSMVDKIVNAGQDVYLNPGFHPSNQAVGGAALVSDTGVRGAGGPIGYGHQSGKGTAGMMLGEAADAVPGSRQGGPNFDQPVASSRRRFNPLLQGGPGSGPQVIMPPQMAKVASQLVVIPMLPPQPQPPAEVGTPEDPPPSDPAPEDPADNH